MLSLGIDVLFAALWAFVSFIALRWAVGRYFHAPQRSAFVAAAVVAAFILGVLSHGGSRFGSVNTTAPPSATRVAHDVSASCASVSLANGTPFGSVDAVGEMRNGAASARTDRFVLQRDATLYAGGWAALAASKTPAAAVCLVIDDRIRPAAHAVYGADRSDVAAAYKAPALRGTGYALTLPAAGLPAGIHHVAVAIVSPGGGAQILPSAITFRVP